MGKAGRHSPHQRGYEGQRGWHMESPDTQKSPRILAEAEYAGGLCAGLT